MLSEWHLCSFQVVSSMCGQNSNQKNLLVYLSQHFTTIFYSFSVTPSDLKEQTNLQLSFQDMAMSPDPRGMTGERNRSQTNQVPFTPEFTKMLTRSSARFGTLSHHSFFSRHNPHPNRVKHIQGEHAAQEIPVLYEIDFFLIQQFEN